MTKLNAGKAHLSGKPHATIKGLEAALREIASWPGVESVVAGRISAVRHRYPELSLTAQTPTISGLKCLARHGQSVQEVFVVSADAVGVQRRVTDRWPPAGEVSSTTD